MLVIEHLERLRWWYHLEALARALKNTRVTITRARGDTGAPRRLGKSTIVGFSYNPGDDSLAVTTADASQQILLLRDMRAQIEAGRLLRLDVTDQDGLTHIIELDAPPKERR